ncbi:homoserine kinase [Candidatus Pelagibacter ubique HTCC1002]|uniref:Homoserine kinase n=1 Tax=Pelagibacter ubique (strain HTCC1002) TaxID=314261 RepID=Q1V0N2_PELU1|nr:homoserine kinase [Candidatus Pelagibacter ubique]EAS85196.1 homoserine kinase [Candidatus Pelagibacter ubique HTCC1002]
MAVYTKLIKKDISSLINNYQINKIEKFQGIKKGIENTNYLLKTKQNKFILTIFEKRVKKKDLPFFMNLMEKLNHKKIICPKPLRTKKGTHITNIKTKSACIVTFLEGKDKTILNNKNCFDVGKNIAKFHKVTAKLKLYRQNSMSIHRLNDLLKTIKFKSNQITPNLKNTLNLCLKDIKNKWPKNLPQGIIHGDLFIDNIFFNKNKFSGFIDFYFSSNDYLIYEIAICINALCFDKKKNKFVMNSSKIKNLINGYESIRTLSKKEKDALNVMCRGAALRYLLTRIYDYFNTPKTTLIRIKDPMEYLQKLIIHNNLGHYKDYYK